MECGVVVPVAKGAMIVLDEAIRDLGVKEPVRVSVLMLGNPESLVGEWRS